MLLFSSEKTKLIEPRTRPPFDGRHCRTGTCPLERSFTLYLVSIFVGGVEPKSRILEPSNTQLDCCFKLVDEQTIDRSRWYQDSDYTSWKNFTHTTKNRWRARI
ncbi:hypothetical protein B0H12DRAFT_786645 [Mycena haematopus]|nr:hypothetical protein B0H12DRAFT_786645 [Mycena haematopus]